jgi:hypothetical protein
VDIVEDAREISAYGQLLLWTHGEKFSLRLGNDNEVLLDITRHVCRLRENESFLEHVLLLVLPVSFYPTPRVRWPNREQVDESVALTA